MASITKLPTLFFNLWYRIRPPAMVSYWKRNDSARAKVVRQEGGSYGMEIEGEDEVMPGFPRGHVLFGPLSKMKHKLKGAFNEAYVGIDEFLKEVKFDIPPKEKFLPAVKEIWRAFEDLENAEVTGDMKERVRLWKTVLCWLMQEDDAYRYRFQYLLERIDMKKVKLSKADKYYFRGKYFKVDAKRRFLGIDWHWFDY